MALNSSAPQLVVTGLGSISAAGLDMPSLWKSALAGTAQVQTRIVPHLPRPVSVYAVGDLPPITGSARRLFRPADRAAHLAFAAAREAWQSASLDVTPLDPSRIGLVIGSSRGPVEIQSTVDQGDRPSSSAYTSFSSIAGLVASALGIQGCSLMTSATCVSGAAALKTAMQLIHSGELDTVLVGAVDAPLTDSLIRQFAATGVLATETGPHALRPFDQHRTGTLLGEGAAFLVLESEDVALRRGASIRGVVQHVALACDPHFRTGGEPSGESLHQTLQRSLHFLKLRPEQIDLVHLHGTASQLNDVMESRCLQKTFGPVDRQPLAWATKGLTGHPLGASALFQTVLTLEAMRHSFLPATANCLQLDPACPIRLSPGSGTEQAFSTALCLTSGFWGNLSSILLSQYK